MNAIRPTPGKGSETSLPAVRTTQPPFSHSPSSVPSVGSGYSTQSVYRPPKCFPSVATPSCSLHRRNRFRGSPDKDVEDSTVARNRILTYQQQQQQQQRSEEEDNADDDITDYDGLETNTSPAAAATEYDVADRLVSVIVIGNENHGSHNRYDVHKARRLESSLAPDLLSSARISGEQQQPPKRATTGKADAAGVVSPSIEWNNRPHHQTTVTLAAATGVAHPGCEHKGAHSVVDGCADADPHEQPSSQTNTGAADGFAMGVGSSKNGYSKKDKKRHSKSGGQKIVVQQARTTSIDDNENHHNAQSDSPRVPIAETLGSKPGIDFSKFRVIKLKAAIDKKPTTLDEKSTAVLKYRTPHFRALATVEVPVLEENQSVQIGWIQTCTEMRFVNTYGEQGVTSWEFPEIVSGKFQMIGDADGKQYPWYGSKNELMCVTGPTEERTSVTVHMNDNFFPQVTWYIPDGAYDKTPRLTHIHRQQRFYTYLVAQDLSAQRYHILRVVEWAMELHIAVNPTNPLGKRAKLLGPHEQTQPRTIPSNYVPLQPYALKPPNANNAQTLVWRPNKGDPKIIVPPIETTMDMDKYIVATRALDIQRTGPLS